jgi:hypothetical protein
MCSAVSADSLDSQSRVAAKRKASERVRSPSDVRYSVVLRGFVDFVGDGVSWTRGRRAGALTLAPSARKRIIKAWRALGSMMHLSYVW